MTRKEYQGHNGEDMPCSIHDWVDVIFKDGSAAIDIPAPGVNWSHVAAWRINVTKEWRAPKR